MKKVICQGPECAERRIHWSQPDTPRGSRYVEVADDWPEHRPAFCSMECALLSGYMILQNVTQPCAKCTAQGMTIQHGKDYVCPEPEVVEVECKN